MTFNPVTYCDWVIENVGSSYLKVLRRFLSVPLRVTLYLLVELASLNEICEEAYDPSLWNHEENRGDEIKIVVICLAFRYKHVEKRK